MPVTAELPEEVQAGATLKLKVKEVSAERVWLQIDPQHADAPTVAATAAGAHGAAARRSRSRRQPARRARRRRRARGRRLAGLHSPTLGRLDLRLELRGDKLLAEVTTPAGRPHSRRQRHAERLRANLEAVGLEATVKVLPRHAPLDLYA